jgi:hypothetical protein
MQCDCFKRVDTKSLGLLEQRNSFAATMFFNVIRYAVLGMSSFRPTASLEAILPPLNNKELVTTATELKAIMAPATDGLNAMSYAGRRAPAASGMPTELYARAQNKFCLILLKVARPNVTASATCSRS